MRKSILLTASLALMLVSAAGAVAIAGRQTAAPSTRPITLKVTPKKPDGSALTGMSFGPQHHIGKDNAALAWSALFSSGSALETTVRIDTRATSLSFGPGAVDSYPNPDPSSGNDARAEFLHRMRTFGQSMAVPLYVRVRIPSDATTVHAEYQAVNGTTVQGRFVKGGGVPETNCIIWAEGYFADADANIHTGKFTLTGVPTASPVWLAAAWGSRILYRTHTISGGPFELGDWTLSSSDLTCPVAVMIPVPAGVPANKARSAISFVRSDGQDVFTFFARRTRRDLDGTNQDGLVASTLQSPDMIPRLAPGTYYVFPDVWTDSEVHTAFIRRLRAGETPPSGVPVFVASGTQTVTGSVDTSAALTAVVNWIRPYVEANAQSGLPPSGNP